jgi:hypothetical protein
LTHNMPTGSLLRIRSSYSEDISGDPDQIWS